MGQAKQRGTFEQRQHAAFDMIDRNYEGALAAKSTLDAEDDATKQLLGMLIEDTLERFDKSGHPLLNADFSQLEDLMLSRGYVPGQDYHDERTFIRTGRLHTTIQGVQNMTSIYVDEVEGADKGD